MKGVFATVRSSIHGALQRFGRRAYSQEGEDLILDRFFEGRTLGFFVDVGAHHPFRFSNTYLFYRRGWTGVNIDAMPGSMRPFRRHRPRDINIEAAIGTSGSAATYYMFNEPALNTFDPEIARERNVAPWCLIGESRLPIRRLADVLAESGVEGKTIDFLTIDVEGRDLDVLRSNDWTRFRPKMVLAEIRTVDAADSTVEYLSAQGYIFRARTFNTAFMLDSLSDISSP